jgi:hypothetical protein
MLFLPRLNSPHQVAVCGHSIPGRRPCGEKERVPMRRLRLEKKKSNKKEPSDYPVLRPVRAIFHQI